MEKATRWIFSLVTAALLLYACTMFLKTSREVQLAGERVRVLYETLDALRGENESLSRQIGMILAEKAPD